MTGRSSTHVAKSRGNAKWKDVSRKSYHDVELHSNDADTLSIEVGGTIDEVEHDDDSIRHCNVSASFSGLLLSCRGRTHTACRSS